MKRAIMKIKMYGKESSEHELGLEDEVNALFEQHPNIKIFDIRQSASGGSMADTNLYISVWYEDV